MALAAITTTSPALSTALPQCLRMRPENTPSEGGGLERANKKNQYQSHYVQVLVWWLVECVINLYQNHPACLQAVTCKLTEPYARVTGEH